MLRRNSSRNKQRRPLGRSKSTNCIVRNPVHALESIDPITAERDAHIAATLSYQRSQERSSGDMAALSGDQSSSRWARTDTAATRHDLARSDSMVSRQDTSNNACGIKRQQSVRFAGPNARPRKALAARARDSRESTTGGSLRLHVGNCNHRSVGGSVQSYGSRLPPSEDYYTTEDDIASAPSSYKKLRKSKSMFTPSISPTDHYFRDGSSELTKRWLTDTRLSTLNKENEPISDTTASSLRAPKSTSFLRQRREQTASRTSSRPENDLAVQLAREKFRAQVEEQSRLKSHPSLFFRSKFKSSESSTGFRRSLRNTSNNSTSLSSAFSGNAISVPKHAGLRKTARKVSKTLKSKLKGLFGRPKSTGSAADQAEEHHDSDGESCLGLGDLPPPEEASMSRVPSRMPSLHAVPSNQQMRSHQGSMESLEGEEAQISDDKSRVTSWTNSVTNTVTSQGTAGDWERQRLSVIKENGMHMSSALAKPLNHEQSWPATTLATGSAIDSQRVYSALMKRLEETKQREELLRKKSVDNFMAHGVAPPRSSSVDPGTQEWSPSTIRCVQADDDVFQDKKKSRFDLEDAPSSPGSNILDGKRSGPAMPSPSFKTHPNLLASDEGGLSPVKSVKSRSGFDSPKTISHRTSAFFASPTSHLFRTASPFRRALQENMTAPREPQQLLSPETRHLNALSALHLPVRRPSASDSERDPQISYADSVYSSTEDVHGYRPRSSTPVADRFPQPPNRSGHGDATIFVSPPMYKPSPSHMRDASTASSVEWKTWLSANVSKLEDSQGGASYTFPTMGHVREYAEIDSPGEVLKPEAYNPWRSGAGTPLKAVEGNSRSNSAQRGLQKVQEWSPAFVDENSAPSIQEEHVKSPPIPCRSSLRPVPSAPNIKVEASKRTHHGETNPRMRPYNTIGAARSSPATMLLAKSSPVCRDDLQLKRRSRARLGGATSSVKSSPGLSAAIEKQFGAGGTEPPGPKTERRPEQTACTPRPAGNASTDNLSGTGLMGLDIDAQVMGSKRMVDLFLSSRRRRIQGSRSVTGSEGLAAAFL